MSRQEKKTRIKGLPPKLLLNARAAHTGSYPSISRGSSDNRTGNYKIFWDDTYVIPFTSGSLINAGAGVRPSLLSKTQYKKLGADLSSSLEVTGNVVSVLANEFLTFTPGQELQPFKDQNHPAVDGKITNSSFYATGSSKEEFGEGFSQPLWDKTKIEIDLTPSKKCSIQINDGLTETDLNYAPNHYMAYWNKKEKIWESVCDGKQFYSNYAFKTTSSVEESINSIVQSASIGFFPGVINPEFTNYPTEDEQANYLCYPVDTFGFPYHQKFHATSSNTIALSNYINRPFLLEKIVLHFSASLSGSYAYQAVFNSGSFSSKNDFYGKGYDAASVTTFFILNQRKNKKYNFNKNLNYVYLTSSISFFSLPSTGSSINFKLPNSTILDSETNDILTTQRDLISYAQISTVVEFFTSSFGPISQENIAHLHRDISLFRNLDQYNTINDWNLNTEVSFSCKAPLPQKAHAMLLNGMRHDFISSSHPSNTHSRVAFQVENRTPYRNGVSVGSRNYKSQFKTVNPINIAGDKTFSDIGIETTDEKYEKNPYFLFPEDNLIFGWQLPIHPTVTIFNKITDGKEAPFAQPPYKKPYDIQDPTILGSGYTLEWDTTPQKIVLYGSYIKQGKEHHDTLNQLLINDNIHEIIGEE